MKEYGQMDYKSKVNYHQQKLFLLLQVNFKRQEEETICSYLLFVVPSVGRLHP